MSDARRAVLIVTSSYHPAVLADTHRARMLARELPRLGWRVEVLTPDPSEVRADAIEQDSGQFFAADVPVHRVRSRGAGLFRLLGARSLTWRMLFPMYRAGLALLAKGEISIVYISTTTFPFFILGRLWKARTGIPYVLDFHDPWVRSESSLPGRNLKRRISDVLSRGLERLAVPGAAGLVSVSPHYLTALSERYRANRPAWLVPNRSAIIPFGAMPEDLDVVRATAPARAGPSDAHLRIHYVGAGGQIMARSFALVCRALVLLRAQRAELVDRVRITLTGTTFGAQEALDPVLRRIARETGVGDLVEEHPARVSYRRSLELLMSADGALVLGVDHAGYTPSKLLSYSLSGKPLLASLHRAGPAYAFLVKAPALGRAIGFDDGGQTSDEDLVETVGAFLRECATGVSTERSVALEPFLARAMAQQHAELFSGIAA